MTDEARASLERALPAYEIAERLGEGAFGVVYEGRHAQLGRSVAIKQLPRMYAEDDNVRDRFVAEAQMVASLDHPHIVPVYDFVESEGSRYLIMERCEGSISDKFKTEGIVTDEACAAVLACLAGLDVAHAQGLLHRDVKPENLMYDTKGVVKLGDFGIARDTGADTRRTATGMIVGTPAYMSPEQCRGDELTPASDVYSVGMMAYELLTGGLPFPESDSVNGLLAHHLVTEPLPLLAARPELPGTIGEVIDRSLSKDLNVRYGTAVDFARALAQACVQAFGSGWLRRRRFVLHWPEIIAETERPADNSPRTGTIMVKAGDLTHDFEAPGAASGETPAAPAAPQPVAVVGAPAAAADSATSLETPAAPAAAPPSIGATPPTASDDGSGSSGPPWPLIGLIGAAIVALIAGVVVLAGGGDDDPQIATAIPTPTADAAQGVAGTDDGTTDDANTGDGSEDPIGEPTATPVTGDADPDLVAALADELASDGSFFTPEVAQCASERIIGGLGTERLIALGVTIDNVPEADQIDFTDAELDLVVDSISACSDLSDLVAQSLAAEGTIPADQVGCLGDAIDDSVLEDVFRLTLRDSDAEPTSEFQDAILQAILVCDIPLTDGGDDGASPTPTVGTTEFNFVPTEQPDGIDLTQLTYYGSPRPCPENQPRVACISGAFVDTDTDEMTVLYWVEGFVPELEPADYHLHFYIDNVVDGDENKAGSAVPGGSWRLWDAPWPATSFGGENGRTLFTGSEYLAANGRNLCVLVADADQVAIPDSGNCITLFIATDDTHITRFQASLQQGQYAGSCGIGVTAGVPNDWRWFDLTEDDVDEIARLVRPAAASQAADLLQEAIDLGAVLYADGPAQSDGFVPNAIYAIWPGDFTMNSTPEEVLDELEQLAIPSGGSTVRTLGDRDVLFGSQDNGNSRSVTYVIPDFGYAIAMTFTASEADSGALLELSDQMATTVLGC